ncbi:MAG: acyl-ACP--UDP-N-acetylglucosamine O-acyltransferase [Pseudomonadota bacterium]
MPDIHPNSVVSGEAKIAESARIGPFCVVGDDVCLGENVVLHSHCTIIGDTRLGDGTEVFPFASLGHRPQDLKFRGEKSRLVIGANNVIRENVTMNPGTEGDKLETRVGDNCLFMVGSHVAHDCQIGDRVIMANNATLAGHVHVEDDVIFGGLSAAHQFCRIGQGAFIGGMCGVEFDIIPYGSVIGNRAHLAGLNLVGLRRRGIPREQIHALRGAFKQLFNGESKTVKERASQVLGDYEGQPLVQQMVEFIHGSSDRGLTMPLLGSAIVD